MIRRPRRSPLFPYTPLFRSHAQSLPAGAEGVLERLERRRRAEVVGHADQAVVGIVAVVGDDAVRQLALREAPAEVVGIGDRKSTRLNSSHQIISYAVFCLKK